MGCKDSLFCLAAFIILCVLWNNVYAGEEVKLQTVSYSTDGFRLHYKPIQIEYTQVNSMTLQIRSCHSAYLFLVIQATNVTDKFVILFGSEEDVSTVTIQRFRNCTTCNPDDKQNRIEYKYENNYPVLNCGHYTGFWIQWHLHTLLIGKIGNNHYIMNFIDPTGGTNIQQIGVASSHGMKADWIISVPGNFEAINHQKAQDKPVREDSQKTHDDGNGLNTHIVAPIGAALAFILILVTMCVVRSYRNEISKMCKSTQNANEKSSGNKTQVIGSEEDPGYREDIITSQAHLNDLENNIYSIPLATHKVMNNTAYDNNLKSANLNNPQNQTCGYEDIEGKNRNPGKNNCGTMIEQAKRNLRRVSGYEDVKIAKTDLHNAPKSVPNGTLYKEPGKSDSNNKYEDIVEKEVNRDSQYDNANLLHHGISVKDLTKKFTGHYENVNNKGQSQGQSTTATNGNLANHATSSVKSSSQVKHVGDMSQSSPGVTGTRYTPGQLDGSDQAASYDQQKLPADAMTEFRYKEKPKAPTIQGQTHTSA